MIKQIKSHWYYVFWGIMSVAVVAGQIYVGSGYREMADATKSMDIFVVDFIRNHTNSHSTIISVNAARRLISWSATNEL